MPFNSETNFEDSRDSWDGNTLMIWNEVRLYTMEPDNDRLTQTTSQGGHYREIEIYSHNRTIEIVYYTGRHLDEIREGRRRGETRRFWENNHMHWGTTAGEEYL